jgi:hypothetical protein
MHTWLHVDDTYILLNQYKVGCLDEWLPVAQVVLRQVYPNLPKKWYVLDLGSTDAFSVPITFDAKAEAINWAEAKFAT